MIITVATHDGVFHADDVFAYVVLMLAFPNDKIQLIRTRDVEELKKADIKFDVGGEYSPQFGSYDHHQKNPPKRESGPSYSSFGLIWESYGKRVISFHPGIPTSIVDKVHRQVERTLVYDIDASDNGEAKTSAYTISKIISNFNPSWMNNPTGEDFMLAFEEASKYALQVLNNEIVSMIGKILAESVVKQSKRELSGSVLVLDTFIPWQSIVDDRTFNSCLYVVFPGAAKHDWRIQAVPKTTTDIYSQRRPLPSSWAGLEKKRLAAASGVPDATFCHKKRFIAGAKSKEAALEMAKRAIENNGN